MRYLRCLSSRLARLAIICTVSLVLFAVPALCQRHPEQAGLAGSIYLEKKTLVEGEPIVIGVKLVNRSSEDLFAWPPDDVCSNRWQLYPVGRKAESYVPEAGGPMIGPSEVIRLRPGETRIWKDTIYACDRLARRDVYQLEMTYVQRAVQSGVLRLSRRVVSKSQLLTGTMDLGSIQYQVVEGTTEGDRAFFGRHQGALIRFAEGLESLQKKHPDCQYLQDYWRFCTHTTSALEAMVRDQSGFYLTDDALMVLARRCAEAGRVDAARVWLERLVRDYPGSDRREEAQYNLTRGFSAD